jgi:hypothetical protein
MAIDKTPAHQWRKRPSRTRQNQQGFCQSGARSSQQAKSDAKQDAERRADQQKRSSKK